MPLLPWQAATAALSVVGAYKLVEALADMARVSLDTDVSGSSFLPKSDIGFKITDSLLFFAPALVLGGAATHLSGFSPRVRQMSAFSVARFQLLTLRLNTLHDWLLMNSVVARTLAERAAASGGAKA